MKKIVAYRMIIAFALGFALCFVLSFIIEAFSFYTPSIEINSTQGVVTSVTKSKHSYIINVEF